MRISLLRTNSHDRGRSDRDVQEEEGDPMSAGPRRLTFREGIILGVLVEDPNIEHHTPAYIAEVTGLSVDDVLSTLRELEQQGSVEDITAAVERSRNN
jgi:DNA-binding MarR family transcriptional regulator